MGTTDGAAFSIALCIESASPHEVTLADKFPRHGLLKERPEHLIVDVACAGMIAPHRWNRRRPAPQDGSPRRRYKLRWEVERLFACLQNYRRIVVRYSHHAEDYLGFVFLGCALILPRSP